MRDTIYRADAIKAIEELPNAYNGWSDAYDKAYIIGTLEEVPKADRLQGKWIDDGFAHRCSICGKQGVGIEYYNYCPNCGSRNRKENE